MAFIIADDVMDTTTSVGTGSIAVSGTAPASFQTFLAGIGNNNSTCYAIRNGSDLEVVIGTLTSGTTLSRDTVLMSTNAGAKVNWPAGSKDVYCTTSAKLMVMLAAILAGAGDAGKLIRVNAAGGGFDLVAQGTGGGLDADKLDGLHAAAFLLAAGGTLTGALNEAKGANVASAATINLDTATGNLVHVTGTTGISTITLAAGAERTIVFDGALTLTQSSGLVLGGANIATAAGDIAVFRGEGSSVTRLIGFTRADQRAFQNASATQRGAVALATVATTMTGTDTLTAVTPDAFSGASFGYEQRWYDATGSRSYSTAFQNTDGKALAVAISTSTTIRNFECSVDGSTWVIVCDNTGGGSKTFLVPPGHYYRINGSLVIVRWSEMRI